MARALQSETVRMSALVANLLDMARIQSGEVRLNLQWQALEEVVGSALRASGPQLQQHAVQTQLPPDLPLVRYDAVLIERVLCNLLENAAKYTPAGSTIGRSRGARPVPAGDGGRRRPGLPPGREEAIFENHARRARIGQAGRGTGAGDLPRHRRGARRHHPRAAPAGQGAAIVFTCRWARPALPEAGWTPQRNRKPS
jgi:two-component system sensor histidine kinase KdpD